MKVSILGAHDINKITRNSEISKEELEGLFEKLGKFFAETGDWLVMIPVPGVIYKIAKAYKKYKGKKIIGLVPIKDKRYGIGHIKETILIADEIKEIDSWYDANGEIVALGDICVCVGFSGGVMSEISFLKYHKKYFNNKTKLVIFESTISERLHKEIEEDLRKDLYYVKSFEEFKEIYDG